MATLADMLAWRDALMRARYSGTRRVTYADKTVEYGSDAEMQAALADLDRRIAAAQGPTPVTTVYIVPSKGC